MGNIGEIKRRGGTQLIEKVGSEIMVFLSSKRRKVVFYFSLFNSKNTNCDALDIYNPHRRFFFYFSKHLPTLKKKKIQTLSHLYSINPRTVCKSDCHSGGTGEAK